MRRWLIPLALLLVLAVCAAAWLARPQTPLPRVRLASPLFNPVLTDQLLEGPARDRWQKPAEIVAALGLRPGESVADVGSGSGYLLPYLSRAVGPKGTVYAEEIQEDFLPRLSRRAAALGDVRVVLGTPLDTRLPPHSVDCFVLLTVYHEVAQPVEFLRGLHAAGRPGATLAIIDFDPNRRGDPPPPEGHAVAESDVLVEAKAAGWALVGRHEIVPSQFYLVFR